MSELLIRLEERVKAIENKLVFLETKVDSIIERLDKRYATSTELTHLKWMIVAFITMLGVLVAYLANFLKG